MTEQRSTKRRPDGPAKRGAPAKRRPNQRGYVHGDGLLHRLDPRVKVLAAIIALVAILGVGSWTGYAVIASLLLATAALGKISGMRLVRAVQGVGFLLLFTVLVNGFFTPGTSLVDLGPLSLTRQGLVRGFALGCRLALVVSAMSLLTASTKPLDLAHGLGWLFSPLRLLRLPVAELAMVTSIALRFVTVLSEEARRIRIAQKARGIEIGDTPMSRATSLASIVVPLFAGALRQADELGLALEARAYRPGAPRGRLYPLTVGWRDWAFLTAVTAVAVAAWIWL